MSKRTTKILIDVTMLLLLPLLYSKRVFGLPFHEVAGLVFLGLLGVHLALNWRWIQGVTARLFTRSLPARTRYTYFVALVFLSAFAVTVLSGVFISRVLFPDLRNPALRPLHFFSAGITLIAAGVHLGLNWGFIASACKRLLCFPEKIARPLGMMLVVATFAFGLYSLWTSNLPRWLSLPFQERTYVSHLQLQRGNRNQERAPGGTTGKHLRLTGDVTTAASTFATYISIMGLCAIPTYQIAKRRRKTCS